MSSAQQLTHLFRPKSVAVVGASRKEQSIGGAVFRNLLAGGFRGTAYPVNPTAAAVCSVRAYPSLSALPEVPELVVIAVPAAKVLGVVEEAAAVGARALAVLSAGFGEVGKEGRAAERKVVEVARRAGMRVLGPNCLGVQNLDPAVRLNATFATTFGAAGSIGFASQSGALGVAALDHAGEMGIGFSGVVALGNKSDILATDVLEYFEADPRTKAILLYLESFVDPERVREIASRVGKTKPIALVKSGRSGAGARAAGSHTGSMVGPDAAVSALCEQSGILRVDSLEQLFDVSMVLADQPKQKGRQVAVVTNAGGPGILTADALDGAGLVLPQLAEATKRRLREVLRPEASVGNPVDVLADVTPPHFGFALKEVLEDPAIHAVVAVYVPPITGEAVEVAKAIARAAEGVDKPVLACFLGTFGVAEAVSVLHRAGIPAYRFPEQAARVLGLVASYVEWRESPVAPPEPVPAPRPAAHQALERARARLGPPGGWLNAEEVASLADAWSMELAPQVRVEPSVRAAVAAAEKLGYPAVLKAEVRGMVHKSDIHAVALNIQGPAELRGAAARLLELEPEALVVQPHIDGGEEWLVGAVRHPLYGPLVTVGAGGVETELRRDLHNRLAPLSARDVEALIHTPRIGRTLQGWRGRPEGDAAALERLIRQISWCAFSHPEIGEIEANPVKVRPPGHGAVAVDLRVQLRPSGA